MQTSFRAGPAARAGHDGPLKYGDEGHTHTRFLRLYNGFMLEDRGGQAKLTTPHTQTLTRSKVNEVTHTHS